MWMEQTLLELSEENTYHRSELFDIFKKTKQNLSAGTFRWTLYRLLKEQKLFKTDYDTYVTKDPKKLPVYKAYYSDKSKSIMKLLEKKYPELNFVVFESVLLNE